ncbi:uncharacterized protein LOC133730627 [Rosa rugosa]|uniref:uncharacterized protein LOC133730627 n=1 Tax=Rosa rugosa TaxID=74645 RepID=UPI002B40E50B|nr:uncharacterized protein LOC133730627 [Rosa rugosa]
MKSGLLQALPIFHGLNVEDPNKHLKEFLFVCSSMMPQEVDEELFKLKAFPFSLEDRAEDWLYELPEGHITSWKGLRKAFLEKYFPTSRVIMLRKKITGITQDVHETYPAYYERFKALLSQCPQHNFKNENLLQFFYEGLTHLDRQMLDASSGGAFVDKTPSEGMKLIANRAINAQQYEGLGNSTQRVSEVSTYDLLDQKLSKLTSIVSQVLSIHGKPISQGWEDCNVINGYVQQGFQTPQFSSNFDSTSDPTYDKIFEALTSSTQALVENQQGHSKDILELKEQMGQVLSFMGIMSDPKPQFAKAVTTRSGRTLVDPPKKGKKAQAVIEEEEDNVESSNRVLEKDPATSKVETQATPMSEPSKGNDLNFQSSVIANPSPPIPFPNRFAKSKKEEEEEKAIL